jgi:hypothetical protein
MLPSNISLAGRYSDTTDLTVASPKHLAPRKGVRVREVLHATDQVTSARFPSQGQT